MEKNILELLKELLEAIFAPLFGRPAPVADYVWPLSNCATPDEMNTSFGPRINNNKWDFHDGIDLPAAIGTNVHAMRAGTVLLADKGGTDGFSSRHIVLKVEDPNDGFIYLVYLHLYSIAVSRGDIVTQGQVIGTVGKDHAHYPHLHFEFRKGLPREIDSVHPLGYLPYADTCNCSPPVSDRFNRLGQRMAARLLFGASSRLEGDLKRVEVDLNQGDTLLACRFVDFDNKNTVHEGNSDTRIFRKNIGVEGYQKSQMNDPKRLRNDLKYGVLVINIPSKCDKLVARVIDVGNNIATSAAIAVPNQTATDEYIDFEGDEVPPKDWKVVTSTTGDGTSVEFNDSAAHTGLRGMRCVDDSTTETTTQRAGIQRELPAGRFEWIAEAWFNPTDLNLKSDPPQSVFLLYFLSGDNLSVAARIRNKGGSMLAGIVAKEPDGKFKGSDSPAVIDLNVWRKWRLHLLRIGTRETTAVLYLDEGGKMVEKERINWDSTAFEPLVLRAGIGLSSAGATATVLTDELRLTERNLGLTTENKIGSE